MVARIPSHSVCALLAAALLGGCAGASTPSQPLLTLPAALADSARGGLKPPASRYGGWVYSAQLYGEDLKIYQRNGLTLTYVETLTQGVADPNGTVATPDGRWYVANGGHSNVLVYQTTKSGPQGPTQVLDDYGQMPVNVDVTPSRNLVAVSNATLATEGTGSVSVYLNRNAEPSRQLTYGKRAVEGSGVAIDRHGNCFWGFNDSNSHSGSIVEFNGCDGKGKLVVSSISRVGGLAIDGQNNLYFVDQVTGIFKCNQASKCKLFSTGYGMPANINFDRNDKHLWVSDISGFIDAVNPVSGAILYKTSAAGGSSDPPFGIAPAPGG